MTTAGEEIAALRQLVDANDRRISDLLAEREARYAERYEAALREARSAAEAAATAIAKSDTEVERRFSIANEWRASINDVIATRLSRDEYERAHGALADKIDETNTRVLRIEGRASGIGASVSTMIAVGALIVSVVFGIVNFSRTEPPAPPASAAPNRP